MSYLVFKSASNATPVSLQLTSSPVSPCVRVSGSYLPITTVDKTNPSLKVNLNGVSYRAQSYSTSSSSSSTQQTTGYSGVSSRASYYYTTSNAPGAMSSITNLTRASTSATLTRASTSATLTRSSTYGYSGYSIPTVIYGCTMGMSGTGGPSGNYWNVKNYGPVNATFFWNNGYSSAAIGAGGELGRSGSAGAFTMQYAMPYPNIPSTAAIYGYDGYWNLRSSSAAGQGSPVYWTAENTNGMAGYTALTCESISGYATRESTYGYATRESISGYAGSLSRQSDYYTSSINPGGMWNITELTTSASESASTTTWI